MRMKEQRESPPPLKRVWTPRQSEDVVDRLMAAGEQYKEHRRQLLDNERLSFRPEISARSRAMAGALPPLYQRGLALARETRLRQELAEQPEVGGRRVTEEEA